MNKATLEGFWNEATGLGDAKESPLAIAIIAEALGENDDGAQAVTGRIYQIAQDCTDFANAITGQAQGLS